MMDPRDIFRDSDTVRITQASFTLITPPVVPVGGSRTSMNLCVAKQTGELDMILNTQTDLRLPVNQNITFKAEQPLPTGQPPRVKWNVDESVNIQLIPGTTLKGIKGSITAEFQEIAPRSLGFGCDNVTPRAVACSFQTVGTQNELDLFVDTAIVGDWKLTNIQLLGGTGAESLDLDTFDVSIRVHPQTLYSCHVWARTGQAVRFDAIVTNLPADATVSSYDWKVPGGTATGPSVVVTLTADFTITLKVTVTKLGQTRTKSHSLSFTTLSPDAADAIEIVCRLRERLQEYMKISPLLPGSQNKVRGFVDPLWDEVPFFRTDGVAISHETLRELLAATQRLRIESASLATSLGRALSQGTDTKVGSKRRARGA